jgi:hypothetical protein
MTFEPARRFLRTPPASSRYVLCPNVILLPLADRTACLLDLDGSFFNLSQTAAQMLKGILEQNQADAIEQIAAEYNADVDRVREDLIALITQLRTKDLIRRNDERVRETGLRTAIAITLSYPGLGLLRRVHNQRLKALALLTLARTSFRLAGWARTVGAWRKYVGSHHFLVAASQRERLIDAIDGAIRRSPKDVPSNACKERALCCWFMLRSVGIPAKLVMGVQFQPFSGHCWCEVDGKILSDSSENCKAYTRLVDYDD